MTTAASLPHVLVAEDQASLRLLFAATLQRAGVRVTAVENGLDAVATAERERPDLILLDIGLPGLDGLSVCRRLKSHAATAGITTVLVTARGQPHERAASFEVGADDYMIKPFSPARLIAEVRRWLAGRPTDAAGGTDVTDATNATDAPAAPAAEG